LGRAKVGGWQVVGDGNFTSVHFSQRKNRLALLNVRIVWAQAVVLHILLGLYLAIRRPTQTSPRVAGRKIHRALFNINFAVFEYSYS
jgi:ABC-type sugar transport system permease subunit